jgi:hypothetical protein
VQRGVRFAEEPGTSQAATCDGCGVASRRLRTLSSAVAQLAELISAAEQDVADHAATHTRRLPPLKAAADADGDASAAATGPALSAAALASAAALDDGLPRAAGHRKYSVVSSSTPTLDPADALGLNRRRRRRDSQAAGSDVNETPRKDDVKPVSSTLGTTASTRSVGSLAESEPEEEPLTTCNRRTMIHPNNSFRRNWDTLIALCLVYNAISLPFRVCFDVPATGRVRYFELGIDGLVGLDMVFNFRTAYFDAEGVLVTNPWRVALRYLKTWFTLDFLATFPYDVIIISAIEGDAEVDRASVLRLPRLIRLARLIRLVRLLRLFRLTRIFQKYQDSLDRYHGLMTTFKLAAVTLMASHFYACFWFLLTSLDGFSEDSWGGAYGISRTNLSNQYISSMHFAIQSITTVGYGDVTPQNDGERLFVVLALLLGITVFGYAIGSIIALIVAHDQRRSRFLDKMRSINSWIECVVACQSRTRPDPVFFFHFFFFHFFFFFFFFN